MRGFTLIEILVVIGIIAILSGIVMAKLGGSSANTRDAKRQADLKMLGVALEVYFNQNGSYPVCSTSPYTQSGSDAGMACLKAALSTVGLPDMPKDPKYPAMFYQYDNWCRAPTPDGTHQYRLWASTEGPAQGLQYKWWTDNFVGSTNCANPI